MLTVARTVADLEGPPFLDLGQRTSRIRLVGLTRTRSIKEMRYEENSKNGSVVGGALAVCAGARAGAGFHASDTITWCHDAE